MISECRRTLYYLNWISLGIKATRIYEHVIYGMLRGWRIIIDKCSAIQYSKEKRAPQSGSISIIGSLLKIVTLILMEMIRYHLDIKNFSKINSFCMILFFVFSSLVKSTFYFIEALMFFFNLYIVLRSREIFSTNSFEFH